MNKEYDLTDDEFIEDLDDSVDLESVDLNKEIAEKINAEVEYPYVRIDGIESEEEFMFFRNRNFGRVGEIPLYCLVDGTLVRIGTFQLSVDSLLAVRNIADYKLTIVVGPEKEKPIDLNDPETIIKFIEFGGE